MRAPSLASDLRTSVARPLAQAQLVPSYLRLSKDHTRKPSPVSLCEADCTLYNLILNGGAGGATGSIDPAAEPLGMGGDDA